MKLQMKREALAKLNRRANEGGPVFDTSPAQLKGFWHSFDTVRVKERRRQWRADQLSEQQFQQRPGFAPGIIRLEVEPGPFSAFQPPIVTLPN